MIGQNELSTLMDAEVHGSDGEKIGKVSQVYLDDSTGEPNWVTVSTGMFGTKESFVPVSEANLSGGVVTVGVSKDAVKGAPRVDADGHLSPEEEQELYRYYGQGDQYATTTDTTDTTTTADATYADTTTDRGTVGHDTSGPNTDEAMTRSEERLRVGTEAVETGKARLRKYIVTENVTQTVPVSHEEITVTREPITDANRGDALSGGELTEEVHEVTLHAERAVVEKETVPVERVRLGTETVTGQQEVTEQVRKEQIETATDADVTGVDTDLDTRRDV